MHIEERGLLKASQLIFRARHTTTLQCMRHTDHMTLNFNNNMSMAVVFLHTEEKPLTRHGTLPSYVNYLSGNFLMSLIKLMFFFCEENSEFQ
jgi:hypothetical protein